MSLTIFFYFSFEDISCLGDSTSLSEVSLDGNPITQEQYYKQIVLRHMQQLKQLDMKRVTVSTVHESGDYFDISNHKRF